MAEVGKETTKMRNDYNAKILNMGGRIDVLEFDNANLIERNTTLSKVVLIVSNSFSIHRL
jgi:hypothetical protein